MKTNTIDTNLTSILQEEFKKTESKRSSDSFLSQKQKEAFLNFEKTGFPSVKNEEWKYTNLSVLLKEDFNPSPASTLSKADIAPFLYKIEANAIVLVNGIF